MSWIVLLIVIASVMLGVAVLMITLSVMTGFEKKAKELILGSDPHVKIVAQGSSDDWGELFHALQKIPGVINVHPYLEGPLMMEISDSFGRRINYAWMRGIPTIEEDGSSEVEEQMKKLTGGKSPGLGDQHIDKTGKIVKPLALSRQVCDSMGLKLDSVVKLHTVGKAEKILDIIDEVERETEEGDNSDRFEQLQDRLDGFSFSPDFSITSMIDSARYPQNVFVSLADARELYGFSNEIHGLGILLKEPYDVDRILPSIVKTVNQTSTSPWRVTSWYQENEIWFQQVAIERMTLSILLVPILFVAAFCFMSQMLVTTVQKQREIGVIKALGATPGQIIGVFLWQGFVVSIVGCLLGLGIGYVFLANLNHIRKFLADQFNLDPFPESLYQLKEIPSQIVPETLLLIVGTAIVLCLIAAFLPAMFVAARMDAAKALRD